MVGMTVGVAPAASDPPAATDWSLSSTVYKTGCPVWYVWSPRPYGTLSLFQFLISLFQFSVTHFLVPTFSTP